MSKMKNGSFLINTSRGKIVDEVSLIEFLKNVTATAELTWGLILSLTRKIPAAVAHVASGGWVS